MFYAVQIRKALELHEQMKQRMGVVIVGPSGSGKSSVWKLLKLALAKRGQAVVEYAMNPKAMPRTQVCVCVCVCVCVRWNQLQLTFLYYDVFQSCTDYQQYIIIHYHG